MADLVKTPADPIADRHKQARGNTPSPAAGVAGGQANQQALAAAGLPSIPDDSTA